MNKNVKDGGGGGQVDVVVSDVILISSFVWFDSIFTEAAKRRKLSHLSPV